MGPSRSSAAGGSFPRISLRSRAVEDYTHKRKLLRRHAGLRRANGRETPRDTTAATDQTSMRTRNRSIETSSAGITWL
jgi:hypothetical protein